MALIDFVCYYCDIDCRSYLFGSKRRQQQRRKRRQRRHRPIMKHNNQLVSLICVVLLVLLLQNPNSVIFVAAASNSNNNDPYQILGLTEKSTQDEIQKQYRRLCLKYHPDKNTQKSAKERRRYETKFKQIQNAYEQIGTPEGRSKYNISKRYESSFGTTSSSSSYSQQGSNLDPIVEAFFRAYRQGQRFGGSTAGSTFSFYTFGSNGPGGRGGIHRQQQQPPPQHRPSSFTTSSPFESFYGNLENFKSIYHEQVVVPLDVLYTGRQDYQFLVKDTWLKRWKGAIRGRLIYVSLYQGLMYALPVMRMNKLVALLASIAIVHATLPKLSEENDNNNNIHVYKHDIAKGTKGNDGNTHIQIQSKSSCQEPDIVFEIIEGSHPLYKRLGNDLHTTIQLTSKEYRIGCTKYIPHITTTNIDNTNHSNHGNDSMIEIRIPPHKTHDIPRNDDGDNTMIIKGKGWPILNAPNVYLYGDLIVHIQLVDSNQKRSRKSKTNKKKRHKSPNN